MLVAQAHRRSFVRRLAMPAFTTAVVGIGVGLALWKAPADRLKGEAVERPGTGIPPAPIAAARSSSPQPVVAEGAADSLALARLRERLRGDSDQGKRSFGLSDDLDRQHRAEPIDPAWSARSETELLSAAILPIMVDSGPMPQEFTSNCRSRSCRISATFESGDAAQNWGINLITQMGATLAQSKMLVLPLPDGRVEVRVYSARKAAGATPVQSAPRAASPVEFNRGRQAG